jgi:hypothetical protein
MSQKTTECGQVRSDFLPQPANQHDAKKIASKSLGALKLNQCCKNTRLCWQLLVYFPFPTNQLA